MRVSRRKNLKLFPSGAFLSLVVGEYLSKYNKNFSSYVLSLDEEIALLYGLDQQIPSSLNKTDTDAEFEQFYHGLLKDMSNIPEENLSTLKTKLRSACEKYTKIKVPYKYQQTVKELSKNQNIVIMKQGKCGEW